VAGEQIVALPRPAQEHILNFIYLRLRHLANPRLHGRPLMGDLEGFWRYRINDYRIICVIEDEKRLVRVVRVGHRYDVYGPDRG
jgi:mRNA interferase RelE/StbE